eukprot:4610618-Pleurochrysis_carterae.AAC.2
MIEAAVPSACSASVSSLKSESTYSSTPCVLAQPLSPAPQPSISFVETRSKAAACRFPQRATSCCRRRCCVARTARACAARA